MNCNRAFDVCLIIEYVRESVECDFSTPGHFRKKNACWIPYIGALKFFTVNGNQKFTQKQAKVEGESLPTFERIFVQMANVEII